jgi:hypothetical protein
MYFPVRDKHPASAFRYPFPCGYVSTLSIMPQFFYLTGLCFRFGLANYEGPHGLLVAALWSLLSVAVIHQDHRSLRDLGCD